MKKLIAKSITPNALNREIYRRPSKAPRKSYACSKTDTKPKATKVFKYNELGVCVSVSTVKPYSNYK